MTTLFARELRDRRGDRPLTAVARAAGITYQRVRQLERGDLDITRPTFQRLAAALSADPFEQLALGLYLVADQLGVDVATLLAADVEPANST
jgi:transcriptional regulator with XRE-family HTH domain